MIKTKNRIAFADKEHQFNFIKKPLTAFLTFCTSCRVTLSIAASILSEENICPDSPTCLLNENRYSELLSLDMCMAALRRNL